MSWIGVGAASVPKVVSESRAIVSGGSFASWSDTWSARTVKVHDSPNPKSAAGSNVKVVGPPVTTTAWVPLVTQARANAVPDTVTGSLNATERLASLATPLAPLAGTVVATWGAASPPPHGSGWAPSPSKVSVANPSHSIDGSKASPPFASPAQIELFRRKVLS